METLAAASVDAVHQYAIALDSLYRTKYDDARKAFSKATEIDPEIRPRLCRTGGSLAQLAQQQQAEEYIRQAISHIGQMTERERYRTRGFHFLLAGDNRKCVEEYGALLNRYPSDARALNQLALCSTQLRQMPKAIGEMRRAVEILPKYALFRNNLALYAAYGSDFQTAEQEALQVQQLNPSYAKGYISLAFAQLGQGRLPEAAQPTASWKRSVPGALPMRHPGSPTWRSTKGVSPMRRAFWKRAAADDLEAKNPELAAAKFAALAYAQLSRGQKGSALRPPPKRL